jgi:hypothetical protein
MRPKSAKILLLLVVIAKTQHVCLALAFYSVDALEVASTKGLRCMKLENTTRALVTVDLLTKNVQIMFKIVLFLYYKSTAGFNI